MACFGGAVDRMRRREVVRALGGSVDRLVGSLCGCVNVGVGVGGHLGRD